MHNDYNQDEFAIRRIIKHLISAVNKKETCKNSTFQKKKTT